MRHLVFGLLIVLCGGLYAQVKVYEGKEVIPTYLLGPNVKSPVFYTGRGVQGAAGHIYPYPAQTNLGEELSDVTYNMIYLENEYLKISILPEFGGRLFSAIDKTNGHELFHRNSVIKPDLIGTLGAWISGGIEWCFPHHHRTTTLMPTDYMIVENDDGSATVWIGETERDLRLRGIIGITLHPRCAYVEAEYRLNNTTEITKNFLFWANVAVTADEHFRTFWPPSQGIGVFHSNTSFTEWPVSHQNYRGIDYTSGVDLTWWKNHPDPVSFFFWQGKEGFVGGYDYKLNAGTVHVGDVIENRTSKLWQFGPGLQGQNARRKLTDDGKAYVELMTGTFSNNQPGYGWFAPHSVKQAKNFWYPIRDLEIVKNATLDAAVTLQLRDNKTIFYGFNTTRSFKGATIALYHGDEILVNKSIDIDPKTPFTETYNSDKELDENTLFTELKDHEGNVLVAYRPLKLKSSELPEVQERPKTPENLNDVEDLYLTGRFVEQFSRPGVNPDDYYLKALKLSPNDYRVNIAMGIRRLGQWRYAEAENFLQKAADKLMASYFQPKEGELFYYLGLAQLSLGKQEDAYRNFSQATWYYQWRSASFYQLALIESQNQRYQRAFELVQKANLNNALDGRILVLKSALARQLGMEDGALSTIQKLIDFDPINFTAYYEKGLISKQKFINDLQPNMQDIDNNYIEIASNYMKSGMFEEGIGVLSSLENPGNPLVNYYLAWLYGQNNQLPQVSEELIKAGTKSIDYCFPYRQETEEVLNFAIEHDPQQKMPYYLLGNLLYDKRPEDAMAAWSKAINMDEEFAMAWRNLAFAAFYHENNIEKAIEYITKAISLDPGQPLWYAELADYYDLSDKDFKECLKILDSNLEAVKKDINAPKSLVRLYTQNGDYDKAIGLLESHHFRTWEGGRSIYYHYVDAHTLQALKLLDLGKGDMAIKELEKAMKYPENLEVGKPLNDERNAMIYYYMGQSYEKMGKKAKAKDYYRKSVNAKNSSAWPDLPYYQAKSHEMLGEEDEAGKIYEKLIQRGKEQREKGKVGAGIGIEENISRANKNLSEAYYLMALGNLGMHNADKAKSLFDQAIKAYQNNLWASVHLRKL